jgi:hypothetical protein
MEKEGTLMERDRWANRGRTVQFYRSGIIRKGWRWKVIAQNGEILAVSSEAYHNLSDCEGIARSLFSDGMMFKYS